jgi:branched-chain amino acid aminotransferase
MPHFINYNGKILYEDMPIVNSGNRGLRYGDGVFETMKLVDSEIKLEAYHFDRLFEGLALLQFEVPAYFTATFLKEQIQSLCLKNNLKKAARIRLNVFRKNGGLYDPIDCSPDFVIEAWELTENYFRLNENGLIVDIYNEALKSFDRFSSLKSNNYLPYAMGAFYAKQNKFNDCLILNNHGRICDATIANVFWVRDQSFHTPPLSEGCIAGVMRRHLLHILPQNGHEIQEKNLEVDDLDEADELFLTNAISGIRWVKECRGKQFENTFSTRIYSLLS